MRKLFLSLLLLFMVTAGLHAQTQSQSSGWLFLLNNTKISEKWGMYADVQVRSADKWANVRNLLIRPGVTYYLNAKNEFTLGYLLNETFIHADGAPKNTLTEHRIWEQYLFKHKLGTVSASHRLRLEQRFIERNAPDNLFAQRFRYFFRFIIPLKKEAKNFERGVFVALQNELFFNVQHKNELNGKLFDQNRAYGALGYRFSKRLDVEAGYMNQSIKGATNNTANNIVQLALYTKF